MRISALLLTCIVASIATGQEMLRPVPFTEVKLTDQFWAPRIQTNRTLTIPHNFKMCEQTGRIGNFDRAAGKLQGKFEGLYFNDSDVYKVMEAASYSLATHPDPKLDAYLDDLIAKLAAAQRPDGYLNTFFILTNLNDRWTNLKDKHELYCAGHLIEAAVAHTQATGKKNFLNVAIKLADHIDSLFGPDKRHEICGHEEIELALVKLYTVTSEKRYLNLAKFMTDLRGTDNGRKRWGEYHQDHKPLLQQDKAVGHAVRFGYFMIGATDIVRATGDRTYLPALDRLWDNVTTAKLYITGGIGAKSSGEAFGADFELPNESAYAETCAGISNAMWNQRMALVHADGKYIDVMERVFYNGFLSGISLSGDRFFYVNPLASRGKHNRVPWFSCACCPPNVARVLASMGGYFYATSNDTLYVNLFAGGAAKVKLASQDVEVIQKTDYPWDGKIQLTIKTARPVEAAIAVRIPAWVEGKAAISLNGNAVPANIARGYATIRSQWKDGDVISVDLPMPARRVYADPRIKANTGRVALARGPIVYCIEGADNPLRLPGFFLPKDAPLSVASQPQLLGGVTVIKGTGQLRGLDGEPAKSVDFTAIPYYAWDNRSAGAMLLWLPETVELTRPEQKPTIASQAKLTVSYRGNGDGESAINDLIDPAKSNDHEVARHTFWPHKGTEEWVQMTLSAPTKVSAVSLYWFDDTGTGECRVPESWKLLYKDGEQWKQVPNPSAFGTDPNKFNRVTFDPVETSALKAVIQLKPKMSTGILEWRVD